MGRDLVLGDLETISSNLANGDPWDEGLTVVDRALIPGDAVSGTVADFKAQN